jgi:ketosteroid isomerase-like protein
MRPALALLFASCATTSAIKPAADPRAAVAEQVQAQYAAIEKLDVEGWYARHASDVVWFGNEPADACASRDEVIQTVKPVFGHIQQAGGTIKAQSSPRILLADGGHAAWIIDDDVKLILTVQGQSQTVSLRHTELLVEKGNAWSVVMDDWSAAIPDPDAEALAKDGKLPTPKSLADGVGADAQPLVAVIDGWMANPAQMGSLFSERADAYIIGSAPGEHIEGGATIRERFAQMPSGLKLARQGLRAGVAGDVGWAAFTMTAQSGPTPTTFRVQQVFVKEGGSWKVVQMHVSHALSQGQ